MSKGHVMGWISTTLALGLLRSLAYFCPQNNPPHCREKKQCHKLHHCLLSIGNLKHVPQMYHCDEGAGNKISMPWKEGKGRVKIFKPSVLLPLLVIQQKVERISFCCEDLVFYTMAIKPVQPFGPGVKTVLAFLPLFSLCLSEKKLFHWGRMQRKISQEESQRWRTSKAVLESCLREDFLRILT